MSELEIDTEALTAEHGPCVVLGHADGSVFVFKRMTRDEFTTRNNRIKRGETDADDKLLQVACLASARGGAIKPGRDDWNAYEKAAVFQVLSYSDAYRRQHGGDARKADSDELPADADPALLWIASGRDDAKRVFGFRKPGRAEVKMFQASVLSERAGDKRDKSALETLLVQLGGSAFAAWLEDNLFAIEAMGEVLVGEFGMNEVRVSGKP